MGPFNIASTYIFLWDIVLTLGNFVLPKKRIDMIGPNAHPEFGGKWPEYVPAMEGDERCSCPAVNALANHGKSSQSL